MNILEDPPKMLPNSVQNAVLVKSTPMPEDALLVKGYDFNTGCDIGEMLSDFYPRMGFQATSLGEAIQLVKQMVLSS